MTIPASVFDMTVVTRAPLGEDLRMAVDLVCAAYCGASDAPIRCVARPEMFTHGESLRWLKRKLGTVGEHIALCDGSAVKLLPDFSNRVFTYGLQSMHRNGDFKNLMRRAPELLGQYASQINSFHRVVSQGVAIEPLHSLLMFSVPRPVNTVWFYSFYLNPNSLEDSTERMLTWGDLEGPSLEDFKQITYIPLTECAINEENFQRMLADMIASVYFNSKRCLLIRLPLPGSDLTERMRIVLDAIRRAPAQLPQARSKNVFLVGDDLSETSLIQIRANLSLVLHQTFEFWRYSKAVYARAEAISVHLDAEWKKPSDCAKKLLQEAFGQPPRFVTSDANEDE